MKNLKETIFLSILTITSSASAELVWVKNSFWQAPAETEQVILIESKTPGLKEICQEYRELVESKPGKTDLAAQELDLFRNQTPDLLNAGFVASFQILSADSLALISQTIASTNSLVKNAKVQDIQPLYSLEVAEIIPRLNSTLSPIIQYSKESLSAISASVGLKPLPIKVRRSDMNAVVQVTGKDTACDLAQGHLTLQYRVELDVKISADDQLRSDQFYLGVEKIYKKVISKKRSVTVQSGLIGVYLGRHIEDSLGFGTSDSEFIVPMIEAILEKFFDPVANPNELWTTFNNEKFLTVPGKVTTDGKVLMRAVK